MAKCTARRPQAPTRTRSQATPLVGVLEEEVKHPDGYYLVPLSNRANLLAHCGYGWGMTQEEAVDDAMEQALKRDNDAYYDREMDQVKFWEVPCL